MNKILKTILPLLALIILFFAQKYLNSSNKTEEKENMPALTSNPLPESVQDLSLPVTSPSKTDILIEHEGFALLYDTKTLCPRWVAWELTAEETRGRVSRQNVDFKEDESVPKQYLLQELLLH